MWALALTLGATSALSEPIDDLRECAGRMQQTHAAIKNLGEQCPHLDDTLNALALTRLLDREERERLNGDAINDLVALSLQYSGAPPMAGPSAASLAGIAEQVNGIKAAAALTWWDHVRSWFKDWLARPGHSGKGWFDEWLQRLADSSAVLNTILYVCMGVVVASALVVVFSEMRAAGLLRRKAARFGAEAAQSVGPGAIFGAAADTRSGVPRLFSLLVARLIATRRLQFERTLTHRELVLRSIFDTPEQRRAFASVSQAAESLVYGGSAEVTIPRPIIDEGNSLLGQLTELHSKEAL